MSADTIDVAVVSTEDETIRETARDYGGNAPFARPAELATDEVTNTKVVAHALEWFANRGQEFETVCLLQVTSPFRSPQDIDGAITKLTDSTARSVVTTVKYDTSPFWAVERDERDEYLQPYFGEEYLWGKTQDQSVPSLHHPNGAVFAAESAAFRETETFYTDRTAEYRMPRERSIDIDEPFDLTLARTLFERGGAP